MSTDGFQQGSGVCCTKRGAQGRAMVIAAYCLAALLFVGLVLASWVVSGFVVFLVWEYFGWV